MRFVLMFLALMAGTASAIAQTVRPEWQAEFPRGNFERAIVDLSEITSGGPPRDGIPALDHPGVLPATRQHGFDEREPVMVLDLPDAPARAYPIRYLIWHEIVNDTVAGHKVAVTYCPLCNTAIVFERLHGGRELSFGVTGRLRHSDMIMYDHQTESWWQQATGQGIVGELAGVELRVLPSWMDSWAGFLAAYPEGEVMARPDWPRSYGMNPYVGYDEMAQPFLYSGAPPPHGIAPLARVVRVGERAWPLLRVRESERIEEAGLVLEWRAGQATALGASRLGQGRDVGSVRVRDLAGRDVAHDLPFAFAFHAFHPNGQWMLGD